MCFDDVPVIILALSKSINITTNTHLLAIYENMRLVCGILLLFYAVWSMCFDVSGNVLPLSLGLLNLIIC